METTLNFSANIQLTLSQLVELARQLPPKDRAKLASMLIEADADTDSAVMSKKELKANIKEGLQDAKLHREGKIKLRTLTEFLEDV
ncbi:hypothetical protein [Runella sp. SP2]|uniref:hypothetical protein n=1 Tax=Runella sp. SP2 TaxID=2268026 RepID=UPI000F0864D1|nr:hypothetical protein [Runella sp. SP2]AYQ36035.1 hypothetical protein DTQ70_29495 [Runella sp. SP2]